MSTVQSQLQFDTIFQMKLQLIIQLELPFFGQFKIPTKMVSIVSSFHRVDKKCEYLSVLLLII
jgi:hypothetical protein